MHIVSRELEIWQYRCLYFLGTCFLIPLPPQHLSANFRIWLTPTHPPLPSLMLYLHAPLPPFTITYPQFMMYPVTPAPSHSQATVIIPALKTFRNRKIGNKKFWAKNFPGTKFCLRTNIVLGPMFILGDKPFGTNLFMITTLFRGGGGVLH